MKKKTLRQTESKSMKPADDWERALRPEQGIYVMQSGKRRMSRFFLDTGCNRTDSFEFGDLTSIGVWLMTKDQLWSIDPDDCEARLLGRPSTITNADRATFDSEEELEIPVITWLPIGESVIDGVACNTFRRQIDGVDAHDVRYVSTRTGFLVQEDDVSPNGAVKSVTKFTIELLGPPPVEVFDVKQIQRELREKAKERNKTKTMKGAVG